MQNNNIEFVLKPLSDKTEKVETINDINISKSDGPRSKTAFDINWSKIKTKAIIIGNF